MKKIIISCLILLILVIGIVFATTLKKQDDNKDGLTKVTVAEPTLT